MSTVYGPDRLWSARILMLLTFIPSGRFVTATLISPATFLNSSVLPDGAMAMAGFSIELNVPVSAGDVNCSDGSSEHILFPMYSAFSEYGSSAVYDTSGIAAPSNVAEVSPAPSFSEKTLLYVPSNTLIRSLDDHVTLMSSCSVVLICIWSAVEVKVIPALSFPGVSSSSVRHPPAASSAAHSTVQATILFIVVVIS